MSDSSGENGAPPPLAPRSSILLEIARNVACTNAPIYAIYITIARRPLARPRFDASKAEGTYGKLLSAAHNHHESQPRQCRWTRDEPPMPLNISVPSCGTARRANVAKGGMLPWFEQSCAGPTGALRGHERSMRRDSSHSIEPGTH